MDIFGFENFENNSSNKSSLYVAPDKSLFSTNSSYSLTIHSDLKVEDLLIEIKAASSKREAREFIKNNAVSINGKKYNDANYVLNEQDYLYSKYLIVKRGKKNYYLVKKES